MSGVLFAVETVLLKPTNKRTTPPLQTPDMRSLATPTTADTPITTSMPRTWTALHSEPVPPIQSTATPRTFLSRPPPPALDDDEDGIQVAAVLVACVFAAMVSTAGLGSEPAFHVPEAVSFELAELPLGVAVGVVCGAASTVLAACNASTEGAFMRLRDAGVPLALLPAIGGLSCGSIALLQPEVTYQGFENVNALLDLPHGPVKEYTAVSLGALVVAKIVATAVCRGSGLVGGLYAPAIFIGAAVGLALWTLASGVFDAAVSEGALTWLQAHLGQSVAGMELSSPDTYALIGAAAMLAANCRVPLTSVLLLFELTQDYTIILPTLATVGFARWSSAAAKRYVKL
jgi:H+/Cl- antiporter ClcA